MHYVNIDYCIVFVMLGIVMNHHFQRLIYALSGLIIKKFDTKNYKVATIVMYRINDNY